MNRKNLAAIIGFAAALGIALGAPLIARAGIQFDLALSKTHTGNFTVGSNGTFTLGLTASQTGTANTTVSSDTLSVTDSLPTGLAYVTGGGPSFTCTNTGQVVHCAGAPTMTSGSTQTMTVVVSAGQAASPVVTNTASYTDSFSGDTVTSNNTAVDTVTVQAAATTTASSTTTSTAAAASASPSPIFTAAPARPLPAFPVALTLVGIAVLAAAGYGWHKLNRPR